MYNCPNCGAPIEGYVCKYCGTYLINIADISNENPTYIRFKFNNNIYIMLVQAANASLEIKSNPMYIEYNSKIKCIPTRNDINLNVDFEVYKIQDVKTR